MRQVSLLSITVTITAMLLAGGFGTAVAEPQKNQIQAPVTCDNGEDYTVAINGMGKAGHIIEPDTTSNIVIKSYSIVYRDPVTKKEIARDAYQPDKGGQSGLTRCTGQVTTEFQGLGLVEADFVFYGFVTPRGKQ